MADIGAIEGSLKPVVTLEQEILKVTNRIDPDERQNLAKKFHFFKIIFIRLIN